MTKAATGSNFQPTFVMTKAVTGSTFQPNEVERISGSRRQIKEGGNHISLHFRLFVCYILFIQNVVLVLSLNPLVPNVGMADPHVVFFNGSFLMYASHDASPNNTDFRMNDWQIWSSPNLVSWSLRATLLPNETAAPINTYNACWATDFTVSRTFEDYYYYLSFGADGGIGVMHSSISPIGPWKDPLNNVPLISPSQVSSLQPPTLARDPRVFFDSISGSTFLLFGYLNYYIARLNDDLISLAEPLQLIYIVNAIGPNGPNSTDDKPYLHSHFDTFSGTNRYYLSWGAFYAIGDNPKGPFTYSGTIIQTDQISPSFRTNVTTGPWWSWLDQKARHGSFFEVNGQSYVAFNDLSHSLDKYNHDFFRDTVAAYVHYRNDGTIAPAIINEQGVGSHNAMNSRRIQAEEFSSLESKCMHKVHVGIIDTIDIFALRSVSECSTRVYFENIYNVENSGSMIIHAANGGNKTQLVNAEAKIKSQSSDLLYIHLCTIKISPTGRWDAYENFRCHYSSQSLNIHKSIEVDGENRLSSLDLLLSSTGGSDISFDWFFFEADQDVQIQKSETAPLPSQLQAMVDEAVSNHEPRFTIPQNSDGGYFFGESNFSIIEGNDFELDGAGATLWFSPGFGMMCIDCTNVFLHNFTIDYFPLAFAQGTLLSLNETNASFVADFDSPEPSGLASYALPDSSLYPWFVNGSITTGGNKVIFWDGKPSSDGRPLMLPNQTGVCLWFTTWLVDANFPRRYGVALSNSLFTTSKCFKDNTFFSTAVLGRSKLTVSPRDGFALQLVNSTSCIVEDVTAFGAGSMAFAEFSGNGAHQWRRMLLTRRPNTNRLLSANADAFQSSSCRIGPLLEDSELAFAGDDFINVHSRIAVVLSVESPSTFIIVDTGGIHIPGVGALLSGDLVEFFAPYSKPIPFLGNATVMSVYQVDDDAIWKAARALPASMNSAPACSNPTATCVRDFSATAVPWRVVFESDVLPPALPTFALVQAVAIQSGGAVLRNNFFHDGFDKCASMNGGNSMLVNNRFERTTAIPGTDVGGYFFWMEGALGLKNVYIANNSFEGTGKNALQAISVHDAVNVTIIGNTFS